MAKSFVIFSALLVLGSAAPTNRAQSEGIGTRNQLTSKEWEQLGNTIEDIFGVSSGDTRTEGQQEPGVNERPASEAGLERSRESVEGQRTDRSGAARLEDREERNREAIGRAQGRLPEREAQRRQVSHPKGHEQQLQQRSREKESQWERAQGGGKPQGRDEHHNSFPLYEFAYGVHDPVTGDKKEQWEKRVGDHVKGTYTLEQPDGKQRIVEYEADDKNGFEAVVSQVDRKNDASRGNVKWGHTDREVAQSYTKFKKVD